MKFKYLSILLILLIPLANSQNWSIGDYWNYTGEFRYNEEMSFENFSFSLKIVTQKMDAKIKIVDTEVKKINNELKGCYVAKIYANISGSLVIEGTFGEKSQKIDGIFDIKTIGTIYFTTKEIAVVSNENDVYFNVTISPNIPLYGIIPSSPVHVVTEYNPPLDFLDFPIYEGEEWKAVTNVTAYGMEEEPITQEISFSFKCVKKLGENVYQIESTYNPLGGLTPFENISSATTIIWNGEKGMIEKVINMEKGVFLQLQLTNDYKHEERENKPPIASIEYSPKEPKVGTKILFESKSKDEDGKIVYYFWDFGDGKSSNQQNPSHIYSKAGEYTVTLIVMDNYGEESKATIKINVEKREETPGFAAISAMIAIILIFLRRRFR